MATDRLIRPALILVLLVAAVLRLRGIDFGLPAFHDPDEPVFMLLGVHLLKDGTLNPGWFGHPGSTTIYVTALIEIATYGVGHLLGFFTDQKAFADAIYANPSIVVLPVRLFIAACGVYCVYLTWRIGERLADWRAGLIAGLVLAVIPLHVQYSQIVRTDVHATVFMLLCVLSCTHAIDSGKFRHILIAAIWSGFAIATKWPAATVFACPVLAAALVARQGEHGAHWVREWIRFSFLASCTMVAALVIASPYLVLDYATVLHNLSGEVRPTHVSVTGNGFGSNLAWYLTGPLLASLGYAGALVCAAGAVLATRRFKTCIAALALPIIFLLAISAQSLVWSRWILPILPFLCLCVGLGVLCLADRMRAAGVTPALTIALCLVVIIIPLARTGHFEARERANDTRTQASAWAKANIPAGKRIAIEYIGLDLLRQGWVILFPAGEAGCIDAEATLSGKIKFGRADQMRGGATVVNLGTIPAGMRPTCAADYAMLIFHDRYIKEKHRFPVEAAAYAQIMATGKIVKSFLPEKGKSGGPIVRIVKFGAER